MAIFSLPLGILAVGIVMHYQGVNANIMSLGGIAIAIGAMVDAAVVMIENAHKHIEAWNRAHPGEQLRGEAHWRVIGDAAAEVGPALVFSLLIIVLSSVPVFTLEAQEGRMFAPLAFTKTYAMAAAAGLSVTLIPVLMGYLVRGRIPAERDNPVSRLLIAGYRPLLLRVLRHPKATLAIAALAALWPLSRLGSEFMPPLDEGDLLYIPSALPGLGAGKAAELLQQTDRMIKTVPKVASVFGKAGRPETATDPAPLKMFETIIQFKPREQWCAGLTPERLVESRCPPLGRVRGDHAAVPEECLGRFRRTQRSGVLAAIADGAVLRVRPKAMTVAVIIAGLVPIMLGSGTGSEVMQRITAPMVGGMITAPLLSVFVVPAIYLLLHRRELGMMNKRLEVDSR